MTSGEQVYYFAYDHPPSLTPLEQLRRTRVGSLRVVVDAAGAVVKRIEYDSFGNILTDSNPTFAVPFGFAGGLHDRDTGLVRFGARDYDPATGKWTAKDPIDFAGGDLNLLGYSKNDPLNFIDPFGLARIGYRPMFSLLLWENSSNRQGFNRVWGHQNIWFGNSNDDPCAESNWEPANVNVNGMLVDNIGYFKDGMSKVRPDAGHTKDEYSNWLPVDFDNFLLSQAAENMDTQPYGLSGLTCPQFNCQDWMEGVIEIYGEDLSSRGRGL